jgi:hypothetical protein
MGILEAIVFTVVFVRFLRKLDAHKTVTHSGERPLEGGRVDTMGLGYGDP